ncbi:MAG TPA: hypothetical protein VJ805_11650 [Nitrospiraceae bacterium]|nr:hypothetical protein [Nitrospiraceae bacterium]
MKTVLFQTSACLLLLAVLFMVGGAMSASVAHDLQHAAHHSAASHSKGICAWMCATGGIAQETGPALFHALDETERIVLASDRHPSLTVSIGLKPRAPPASA